MAILQSGLLHRATEVLVPVMRVSEMPALPTTLLPAPAPTPPAVPPAPPPARPAPERRPPALVPTPPAPLAAVAPVASSDTAPPAVALVAPATLAAAEPFRAPASAARLPPAPAVAWAAPAATPAPPAVTPPERIELPSSLASYLHNPRPVYPAASRRLGEQGRVVVRVLIGVDGTAQKAQVHETSGHERLDQAALSTALQWRYVPGKRSGVPEAMWFHVPIQFVLE